VSIPKINTQVWLFLHEEEDNHNHTDERKEYGAEDRYSLEPQKAHLTGEFVIVEKFCGHALHHLASRLANVIRQEGMEADEKLSFSNFFLNSVLKLL